jgi:hypothetical protein
MSEVIENKKPWLSKTIWMSVLTALASLYPPAHEWIADNPVIFSWAIGGVFAGLRVITKDGLSIK